jgi:hypothetical protein
LNTLDKNNSGTLKEYIGPDISKDDFRTRLIAALENEQTPGPTPIECGNHLSRYLARCIPSACHSWGRSQQTNAEFPTGSWVPGLFLSDLEISNCCSYQVCSIPTTSVGNLQRAIPGGEVSKPTPNFPQTL